MRFSEGVIRASKENNSYNKLLFYFIWLTYSKSQCIPAKLFSLFSVELRESIKMRENCYPLILIENVKKVETLRGFFFWSGSGVI